jgi:16S rRNA (guanine527-N7)-methyltransferase
MIELKSSLLAIPHISHDDDFISSLQDKISAYLTLLDKWNQAYNLTAIRDKDMMISHHILDSLAIMPWLNGEKIIDVGSGAGLPGIPLALARPDLKIFLLDSNGKKARFLQEAKRVLNLKNVEVIQSRVEDYNPSFNFDTVISRAFSSIDNMLDKTNHLLADKGIWLAMKGQRPDSELSNIKNSYQIKSYPVAFVDGERCCVILEK